MAEVSAPIVCLCLHRDESLYRGMSLHLSARQSAGKTRPRCRDIGRHDQARRQKTRQIELRQLGEGEGGRDRHDDY